MLPLAAIVGDWAAAATSAMAVVIHEGGVVLEEKFDDRGKCPRFEEPRS